MGYTMNIAIIRHFIKDDEILAQMAEEAAELAQACLKLRRAIRQDNPTPISTDEAARDLEEEWADVALCATVLRDRYQPNVERVNQNMQYKAKRWADRLQGIKPPTEGGGDP